MKALIVLALLTCACSSARSPLAPTTAVAPLDLAYAIHVPDAERVHQLLVAYPHGIRISPVEAQHDYDYTTFYDHTPNVYAGWPASYVGYQYDSIVIAPLEAASVAVFSSSLWPEAFGATPPATYAWVGVFEFYPYDD